MNADDRLAIAETLARAGHVVDQGDLDRLGTVFTPDAGYDMSAVGMPVVTGLDAIRAGALGLASRSPVAHHVTNVVVVSDEGEQASVDSKGLLLMLDGTMQSVTHHDVLRRSEDGWRIARRVIVPQRVPLQGLAATPASA